MSDDSPGATISRLGPNAGWRFWLAIVLTGLGTGASAAALTLMLQAVQHIMWPGNAATLLDAAAQATPWRHIVVLLGAGLVTGAGQIVLVRLTSSNSIDITEAIWFSAGRLPALRTLGSAVLSVILVGMGASLGREGAPKQAGAVIANVLSDKTGLSDEQRRLLVACGAGAGMAAAYGVPLGGALFALEVLRGMLALRLVLPALLTSLIATATAFVVLPDAPTYIIPHFDSSAINLALALLVGPIAGLVSVGFVRTIAWADRNRPRHGRRLIAPVLALGVLGLVSIPFPQLLGNGKDIAQLAFANEIPFALLLALLVLKPAATVLCLGSGVPGGLFTPSLALGALLGAVVGQVFALVWPDVQPALVAIVGAGAVLAATTQGPISAVVLMMELTGQDRSFIVPLLLAVVMATLVSRLIEPRSIYDARLTDEEIAQRQKLREPAKR
ncbi:chloride channel protein [Bradyrhizobium sp.]|uniref:chloride channel protein n=1 Tax=Bradyrhizobium sp. TaxID=376 RepID=UPI0025B9AF38|nr:chloride channel protein [Bradyrhizobium sp.]